MTSKNPKKKIVKKVLNKIKPVKKDKDVKTTPPYFPPPYFSNNWGGNASLVSPVTEKESNQPPYFPPPYFSTNWGGGNQKASSTDK